MSHRVRRSASRKDKLPLVKMLDRLLFWLALFLAIAANIIVLVGVSPLIIRMPLWFVLLCFSVIGLCCGFFIDNILRDIDLTARHYAAFGLIMPLIATLTILFTFDQINSAVREIGFIVKINPLLVLLVYIISFSLPHIAFRLRNKRGLQNGH